MPTLRMPVHTTFSLFLKGMVNKMAIQKLKESTRMRDRELIQRSLDECKTCEVPDNDPDVKKAKRTLKVLGIKDSRCL